MSAAAYDFRDSELDAVKQALKNEERRVSQFIDDVNALRRERDGMCTELERVQKQCAAMREALNVAIGGLHAKALNDPNMQRILDDARFNTDAGRDFISRESVLPLVEALEATSVYLMDAGEMSPLRREVDAARTHAKRLGLIP